MSVPEELLKIMVCTVCRSPLEDQGDTLRCVGCGVRFPVQEGVPVMLPEAAIPAPDGGEEAS
ncbi:MAG: Trm112 family protein [Actinobacteria bacterium]|nr:Trm112 family protein [Actinomycetota bacterium]